MEKEESKLVFPEEVFTKILLGGLSLKSIARFRSVSKVWKSILDSELFRDLYESLNPWPSVSWSITNNRNHTLSLEIVGHYGCERWGLTDSLGSWIMRYNPEITVRKASVLSCADGLVLLYTETSEGAPMYHVGNPLLQQWVRIPLPPHLSGYDVVRLQEKTFKNTFSDTGLVTKMEKGIVVGYKVVWFLAPYVVSTAFTFMIYSSETGLWKTEEVRTLRTMGWSRIQYSVPLNGILHWLGAYGNDLDANYVVSYNCYNGSGDNDLECRTIPFPALQFERYQRFKRTITTSVGSVVYANVFNDNGTCTLRVWRLVKYCDDNPAASWQLSWTLNTSSSLVGLGEDYFPIVMHPLSSEIIYLWSRNKNGLVVLNLRTRNFSLQTEESTSEEKKSMDGCTIKFSGCKEYMDSVYDVYSYAVPCNHGLYFSQYVLPRWLNPLPTLSS